MRLTVNIGPQCEHRRTSADVQSRRHAVLHRRRARFAPVACAICTNGRQQTAGNASMVRYWHYIAACKTIAIPSGCDANAGLHVATATFGTELEMYEDDSGPG